MWQCVNESEPKLPKSILLAIIYIILFSYPIYPLFYSLICTQAHIYKWENTYDAGEIYFRHQTLTHTLADNPVPVLTITSHPVSYDRDGLEQFSEYCRDSTPLHAQKLSTGPSCLMLYLRNSTGLLCCAVGNIRYRYLS